LITRDADPQADPAHWAQLDHDSLELVRRARGYLDEIAPLLPAAERDRALPVGIIPGLLDVGFVRGAIGIRDGGLGLSHLQTALLMEEAGRCWASIRTTANILSLVAELLSAAGSSEQKRRFLRPLLAGQRLGWFAVTEPEAGSDAASLATLAERLPTGSYRLTGRKAYITNASYADFGIVLATTDPGLGARGITAFLVEHGAGGYRVMARPQLPVRAASCCDVLFDGVVVPAGNVLGDVGRGLPLAMRAINSGRLNVSAGCTGIAQAALEAASAHAVSRTQFGKPLAGFQLVQQLIANIGAGQCRAPGVPGGRPPARQRRRCPRGVLHVQVLLLRGGQSGGDQSGAGFRRGGADGRQCRGAAVPRCARGHHR